MSGVNKVFIVGRLGGDPELRTTASGKNVCSFSVATGDKERTEWHKIIAWEKTADLAKAYLSKGKMVHIEGKIQSREYESQGVKKLAYEIICTHLTFIDSANKQKDSTMEMPVVDEDVPF